MNDKNSSLSEEEEDGGSLTVFLNQSGGLNESQYSLPKSITTMTNVTMEEPESAPSAEPTDGTTTTITPSGKQMLVQIYNFKKKHREEHMHVILKFNQKPSA
eukprot:2464904-Ditylum_brightwellii.AAC.1